MALLKSTDEKAALDDIVNASGDAREQYIKHITEMSMKAPDWYIDAYWLYSIGAINYTSFQQIISEHVINAEEPTGREAP